MTTNTHWTDTQRTRLRACIEAGDTIAYWCSDAFGRPSNGGNITIERAAPGVDLARAYRPASDIPGWTADDYGYLGRS